MTIATVHNHCWHAHSGTTTECSDDEAFRLGRKYFTRLDLQVNAGLVTLDADTIYQLTGLRDVLKKRLFLRRDATVAHDIGAELPTYDREVTLRISALLLEFMRSVFGSDLCDPLVLSRISHAHDLFAVGRLRRRSDPQIRVPNNVPDGAAIFLYPEFSLLAIDQRIEPEAWQSLLPLLIRMAALYLKTYEMHPRERLRLPRLFDEYGEPPEVCFSVDEVDGLASTLTLEFDRASPAQVARALGDLATRAFNDRI